MRPEVVSVCVANFNGEGVLCDCIDSLLGQIDSPVLEIIIHDDASTDRSLALVNERYPRADFPQIRVIQSRENVGFCIANNRMASMAMGDFLLLLNNDAALAPNAIRTLLTTAEREIRQGILTLPQMDWESGVLVDRGCMLDPFYNPVPNIDPAREDVAMVMGACLWLPRSLWLRLGGFPEWFGSIAEDMQLCCQARLCGFPVRVASGSFYRHHQGSSFGGGRVVGNRLASTYRRRRLSERNKTYVMVLCSPPARLWLTLPLHLLFLALEAMLLAVIKGNVRLITDIYANVFITLWRERRRLLAARSRIQMQRTCSNTEYGEAFAWIPRKLTLLLRYGVPVLR